MKNQNFYNQFINQYLDKRYKVDEGVIKLSKADCLFHNMAVAKICVFLFSRNYKFITQARMKCDLRPDIICFKNNDVKIIEVRHTEKEKDSIKKLTKLPEELHAIVYYFDVSLTDVTEFIEQIG